MNKYKIGIDIGGTNTDAVMVDKHSNILSSIKTTTTENIDEGFSQVLDQILRKSNVKPQDIQGIFLGTTHATNAILQQKDLYKVGVIRIAGHKPDSLPSCYGWPKAIQQAVHVSTVSVDGGFECDGSMITPFKESQIKDAVACLLDDGAESIAVVGVFSPLNSQQELQAQQIAQQSYPGLPVSMSHQLGGIGFIERENSTILNACLKKVMATGFKKLEIVLQKQGLNCPLWITQNNGSLIDLKQAIDYPVLTISAGPTNSFIGGSKLSQHSDAIVVDIGGTSTDVGVVRKGYPRRSLNNTQIGGINLNFSMPDVLSIGLGGGSYVNADDIIKIGPVSCARKLLKEAYAFGGNQLTFTDISLALGHVEIFGTNLKNIPLPREICGKVMDIAVGQIQDLIGRVGLDERHLPVVVIGGGAALLPKGNFLIPQFADVANAYGAALAEISATIDTVVSLEKRQTALEELQQRAIDQAVFKGADAKKVQIVDMQIIPYHYVPNKMARVMVTASGHQK